MIQTSPVWRKRAKSFKHFPGETSRALHLELQTEVGFSKVTELKLGRMREVVWPWLEETNTETGTGVVWQQVQLVSVVLSHWWGVVETLCSHWLISQDGFETQSVENLRPPNRKSKKRTKRRAVERFTASYQERIMRNK